MNSRKTRVKDEPNIVLCGNRSVHHSTNLKTGKYVIDNINNNYKTYACT
jgi:hypothetical protein